MEGGAIQEEIKPPVSKLLRVVDLCPRVTLVLWALLVALCGSASPAM